MNSDETFEPMDPNGPNRESKRPRVRQSVIKSDQKQVKGSMVLKPHHEDTETGVEFFQPIYEGEVIVGVLHKCSCGKTAELRFQYEDQ